MKTPFAQKILETVDETFFAKGRPFHFVSPLFEAADVFFFTPNRKARGKCHVRDCNDFKRMMMTVIYALIPCVVMGLYNVGYQANRAMEFTGATQASGDWHAAVLNWIDGVCPVLNIFGASPGNIVGNLVHGSSISSLSTLVTMIVGIGWKPFSRKSHHEINGSSLSPGSFPVDCLPNISALASGRLPFRSDADRKRDLRRTGATFLNTALVAVRSSSSPTQASISGERFDDDYVDASPVRPVSIARPYPIAGGCNRFGKQRYSISECFSARSPAPSARTIWTFACTEISARS